MPRHAPSGPVRPAAVVEGHPPGQWRQCKVGNHALRDCFMASPEGAPPAVVLLHACRSLRAVHTGCIAVTPHSQAFSRNHSNRSVCFVGCHQQNVSCGVGSGWHAGSAHHRAVTSRFPDRSPLSAGKTAPRPSASSTESPSLRPQHLCQVPRFVRSQAYEGRAAHRERGIAACRQRKYRDPGHGAAPESSTVSFTTARSAHRHAMTLGAAARAAPPPTRRRQTARKLALKSGQPAQSALASNATSSSHVLRGSSSAASSTSGAREGHLPAEPLAAAEWLQHPCCHSAPQPSRARVSLSRIRWHLRRAGLRSNRY